MSCYFANAWSYLTRNASLISNSFSTQFQKFWECVQETALLFWSQVSHQWRSDPPPSKNAKPEWPQSSPAHRDPALEEQLHDQDAFLLLLPKDCLLEAWKCAAFWKLQDPRYWVDHAGSCQEWFLAVCWEQWWTCRAGHGLHMQLESWRRSWLCLCPGLLLPSWSRR